MWKLIIYIFEKFYSCINVCYELFYRIFRYSFSEAIQQVDHAFYYKLSEVKICMFLIENYS